MVLNIPFSATARVTCASRSQSANTRFGDLLKLQRHALDGISGVARDRGTGAVEPVNDII